MIYALPYGIMVLWLIGGQVAKWTRRFGIPTLSLITLVWKSLKSGYTKPSNRWKLGVLLLTIPILSTGYGINSSVMKLVEKIFPKLSTEKKDLTVRILYAIILSLPLGIYTLISPESPIKYLVATIALIGAFCVRADKLFSIGKFDVLIEDIVRSLTFGYAVVWIFA